MEAFVSNVLYDEVYDKYTFQPPTAKVVMDRDLHSAFSLVFDLSISAGKGFFSARLGDKNFAFYLTIYHFNSAVAKLEVCFNDKMLQTIDVPAITFGTSHNFDIKYSQNMLYVFINDVERLALYVEDAGFLTEFEEGFLEFESESAASTYVLEAVAYEPEFSIDNPVICNNGIWANEYLGMTWEMIEDKPASLSYWSSNGNNIYYNDGNVGVGTTLPTNTLTAYGACRFGTTTNGITQSTNYGRFQNLMNDISPDQGIIQLLNRVQTTDIVLTANRTWYNIQNLFYNDSIGSSTSGKQLNAYNTYNYIQNARTDNGEGHIQTACGTYNHIVNYASTVPNTIENAFGTYNWVRQYRTGTITNAYGTYNRMDRDAGTITNSYGVYVSTEGTITNSYGVYCAGEQDNYFSGNVGIGTTNPLQKLHVVGNINLTGDLYKNGVVWNPTTFNGGTVTTNITINNSAPTIYFRDTDHNSAAIQVNGDILSIQRGGDNTTTMTKVLARWPIEINLTNNYTTLGGGLTVNGDGLVCGLYTIDYTFMRLNAHNPSFVNSVIWVVNNYTSQFYTSGGFNCNNGMGVNAAGFFAYSDEKCKANICSSCCNDDLNKIMSLKAKRYNFKKDRVKEVIKKTRPKEGNPEEKEEYDDYIHEQYVDENERHTGFLAQDVEEVYPELVNSSGSIKTLNYSGFVPVLINAFQGFVKRTEKHIETLEERLAALEAKINLLVNV
jgi:hypothetical protein